jgi:hypothetical protein
VLLPVHFISVRMGWDGLSWVWADKRRRAIRTNVTRWERPCPVPGYLTVPDCNPLSVRRVRALATTSLELHLTADTLAFDEQFRSSRPARVLLFLEIQLVWRKQTTGGCSNPPVVSTISEEVG